MPLVKCASVEVTSYCNSGPFNLSHFRCAALVKCSSLCVFLVHTKCSPAKALGLNVIVNFVVSLKEVIRLKYPTLTPVYSKTEIKL